MKLCLFFRASSSTSEPDGGEHPSGGEQRVRLCVWQGLYQRHDDVCRVTGGQERPLSCNVFCQFVSHTLCHFVIRNWTNVGQSWRFPLCVQGDIGTPLVFKQHGVWIQAGIAIFSLGCGETDFPSVYIRVSKYMTWISGHITDNGPGFVNYNSSGTDDDADFFCANHIPPPTLAPTPANESKSFEAVVMTVLRFMYVLQIVL